MRKALLLIAALMMAFGLQAQDTIWVKFDNRFKPNKTIDIKDADSIVFSQTVVRVYIPTLRSKSKLYSFSNLLGNDTIGQFQLTDPGRILYQPGALSGNFESESSQWCFARSMESEHFVVFWEKGFGTNPKKASNYSFDPEDLLKRGEQCWDKYVEMGFVKPGKSTTDTYKIIMLVYYTSEWIASGSGYDSKVGSFNVSPWAITARGGHTVAHEIGHTFQYLVSCDLGMQHGFNYGYGDNASGGNGWWESCANWQAYKLYPSRQFTDGEYYEQHLANHHLNMLHEDWRYACCYIQDWWCQLYGSDFIGRLWRESKKPEDPVEAYMRINNLTQEQFNDEQYLGYAHMAAWDIDAVRSYAKSRIGGHNKSVVKLSDGTWQSDSARCPQNYGYNIIAMKRGTPGDTVTVHFKGIAGAKGYRAVNTDKAGWRYGFVVYKNDGTCLYSEIGRDSESTLSYQLPEKYQRLFFVVMGAPTEHWRHPWDNDITNDEQWPYQVTFEGTDILNS